MKVVIAVLMTVFLSLGTANSLFAKDGKGAEGKRKMPEEMLKKFDKDGDGKLSEEEKKQQQPFPELADVKEDIKGQLEQQETSKKLQAIVEDLKKKGEIEKMI